VKAAQQQLLSLIVCASSVSRVNLSKQVLKRVEFKHESLSSPRPRHNPRAGRFTVDTSNKLL
jgi:hypothetical protein